MNININQKSWEEKNNINAFIELIDYCALEKTSEFSISIFDIMTKAHLKNVYKDLDWQMVNNATELFEYKCEQNKIRTKQGHEIEIDVIVKSFAY
jgi:hypothetical protein